MALSERLKGVKRPETEQRIQDFFSSVAKRYDLANTLMSWGRHYPWKRITVDVINIKEGDNVLDVCSGTEDLAIMEARKVGEKGQVTALDFNKEMQKVGEFKVKKFGLDKIVKQKIGDAEELPFDNNQFDAVTIGTAARHLRCDRAFAEMFRILKPGGRVACLEFFSPPNRLWRGMYNFYSYSMMPHLGTWITGDKTGVYKYLPDSIRLFYTENRFKELYEEIGFENVQYRRLTGGIACVHWGTKPELQ